MTATPQTASRTAPAAQTQTTTELAVGSLVRARGREWVVLPGTTADFLLLQPLGGGPGDAVGVFPDEGFTEATFAPPAVDDLGDAAATDLLRTALRVGSSSSAGPFRSLSRIAVTPRNYQYVPLLMALRQDPVRLLIADDVGIGKTIEAGLIASELLAQGTVTKLAVLCSPSLAEQWQRELRSKFGLEATLVLAGTIRSLEKAMITGQSLFTQHPLMIVSTDFIKSDRRRHEFVKNCPELVIVDEAHNAVAGASQNAGSRAHHQRYDLLKQLAADPTRHLVLATATPHSGDESAFANLLGLCRPELATADLTSKAGSKLLAGHFVQRRRADIRRFLDQNTPFPTDRQTKDEPYTLSPAYRELFADVLAYAREQVAPVGPAAGKSAGNRVRWWSALGLLRALASSPAAAAATLTTRSGGPSDGTDASADLDEIADIDARGRAAVLDSGVEDLLEAIDWVPGALPADDPLRARAAADRRRCRVFAQRAAELAGPEHDLKLGVLLKQVRSLLAAGYAPIIFCRFINTADYVGEFLTATLSTKSATKAQVAVVTGHLPPDERERRIGELTDLPGTPVLVATDCLSEGVNLQGAFSAVIHYDLAWNPTRHEQREGRVDRFGQRKDVVRAVTIFGEDNGIDGIVLEVLIRKHRAIAKATGVAVPVPGDGQSLVDALTEGLLLRASPSANLVDDLTLDLEFTHRAHSLDASWQSAAEHEKASRARFAQHAMKPDVVLHEVAELTEALGTPAQIRDFVRHTLTSLGASLHDEAPDLTANDPDFTANLIGLPLGLRDALACGDQLQFRSEPPVGRGEALLARTDPVVQTLAAYVLESALDPVLPAAERPARRAGVIRTHAVTTRTTLLLVRFRFRLTLPTPGGLITQVAEDARVLAFAGRPQDAAWLPDSDAEALLTAAPAANLPEPVARHQAAAILDELAALDPHLGRVAVEQADRLLASHRRIRQGSGAVRQGLAVVPLLPVDILSTQVLLPVAGA